ncbi:hypothetical protein LPTSP4_02930 [Leptospira ryugenii]|uniref:Uncharacterized protein n=2 Tax=Leptospira ryugenii TaxID=1917863 RepID=A0A2P2DVZ0_9LEPT|nr:hypothetical protein LPTSP4_02930 [Leptospira ryugenii]
MSYCIDIYQDKVVPQKNFINLALYISFFPQLIAGPIVRYIDINKEIEEREETFKDFQEGLERFIIGLSKKVLIANVFAKVADRAFGIPLGEQEFLYSLIGAFAYTFQIFFDFSGYSDMAIGLGRMFGFHFQENFRYPYSALSMKEFWRRWHISLSTWFRDYLYIPLGGNRGNIVSTGFNLLLVFTLCGLWHGANWTFLIWGLWHGLFLVLERSTFGELITRAPFFIQKVYTMFVIVVGWIFFRAESLRLAMDFFSSFGIFSNSSSSYTLRYLVSNEVVFIFLISVCISSERIVEKIRTILATRLSESLASFLRSAFLLVLLYLSSAKLALGTYNPFIYFRF